MTLIKLLKLWATPEASSPTAKSFRLISFLEDALCLDNFFPPFAKSRLVKLCKRHARKRLKYRNGYTVKSSSYIYGQIYITENKNKDCQFTRRCLGLSQFGDRPSWFTFSKMEV